MKLNGYKIKPDLEKYEGVNSVKIYRNVGITVIFTLLTIDQLRPVFQDFFSQGIAHMTINDYAICSLYITAYFLVGSWIWSSWYELDKILCFWLDPSDYSPPSSALEFIFISFFTVFLCILIFSVKNILVFSILFFIYSLFNVLVGNYVIVEIGKAINGSNTRLKKAIDSLGEIESEEEQKYSQIKYDACKQALKVITNYWCNNLEYKSSDEDGFSLKNYKCFFYNWQFIRDFCILIGSIIILVFTIIGKTYQITNTDNITYFSLASLIIFSEVYIFSKRLTRDFELRRITFRLNKSSN